MPVVTAMRLMNSTAPRENPTTIPSVRSRNTVNRKVASSTTASPRELRSSVANSCFSAMFQATIVSTPASAASGISEASGAASSMNSRRKTECSMPAIGPRAPARTLVAVRAIVPVAQMPPNSAEPMLATPWATSSQLDRWRRPVMPSATTAESSDSMAPSSAKDRASGRTACILARLMAGRLGAGSIDGMPPKRVPIVSTGKPKAQAATDVATTAISMPGQCGRHRFSPAIRPIVAKASATVAGLTVPKAGASASILAISSPGSLPCSVSPNSSLIWLAKMMTAMPAVNPTVTG